MSGALAVLLLLVSTHNAFAQRATKNSPSDKQLIKQLLQRIETLEDRLQNLETAGAHTTAFQPEQVSLEQEVACRTTERPPVPSEAASHEGHDGMSFEGMPTLQMRGFADVQYHISDQRGEKNAFALGQLDLFITSRLADNLDVLAELVLEGDEHNAFGFEAERLLLQYRANEYLTLGVGRYHSSIGYYNTAYHHGTWFQTATGRPFLFAFEDEGGILPIHNVGLTATGAIPSGRLGLHYVAEVGNGRSYSPGKEQVAIVTDNNNGKTMNLGLFARPEWVPGLQIGGSVYRDRLSPEGLPSMGQTIFAGHVVYTNPRFEWLNEGILMRHDPRGQHSLHTTGFYTQVSQQFGKFRPYFRYQYLNVPAREPLFGTEVGRRNGPSLGVRYDLSEFAALKVQYDRTDRRGRSSLNEVTMQASFAF